MNGNTKLTATLLLCGAIALGAIGGCAKRNDQLGSTRTRHDDPADSSFAAGAGRAPTAATSYSFAKILVSQGRDRDALYVLSHIVREHPKYLPAYNEMAGVYVRADRLDDAIAALTSGLEQAPTDGVLHNNLGMCYLLKEDPAEALESFTRATEAVPNNATFRANRATALALTGRDVEAESEFKTVVGSLQSKQNLNILARARQAQSEVAPAAPGAQPAPQVDTSDSPAEEAPATQPTAPAAAIEEEPEAAEEEAAEETEEQIELSQDDRPHVGFNVLADLEVSEQHDYYTTPVKLDVVTSDELE